MHLKPLSEFESRHSCSPGKDAVFHIHENTNALNKCIIINLVHFYNVILKILTLQSVVSVLVLYISLILRVFRLI